MILLLLFITQVYSLDICRQLSTYEKCIGSKSEYCRWFPNQHYCRQSIDLVQGCNSNLSLKLCMLQISTTQSTQALCIFDTICHPIYDSTKSKCSQNLNKYGCLGVLNKSQYCKWEDGKCVELTSDEFTNINTIFPTLELSMSVCPLINGYLIAHSNLVQQILTTAVEYALLAQADESQITTDYEEGTLQNNYVDQNGQFIWFQPQQQQQFNIQQLQINDINRNGCIGIDIQDDNMFRKLFNINNQKIVYGVNHIFCQYININPFITQISVFLNDECQLLQIDEFVNKTDIQCQNLGRNACQLAHSSLNCEVKEPINQYEISCQYNKNQIANDDCQQLLLTASSKKCSLSNTYCFFDFQDSIGYCDDGCYNLNNQDCIQKSNCIWIDANSDLFINCIPQNGCNQKGLSQIYCRDIPLNCIWQNDQCQYGDLRILTCQDANTKYSCVNIQRQDQLCIWYNDECINTLTHNLFKNYYSLPQNIIRNRNQCVLQDKLYYRYNEFNKQCIQDFIIDTQNLKNINKYFCLNLQLYTQWNHDTFNCEIIQPNTNCDTRENINSQLCTLFPNCIYDEINYTCKLYTTEQIKCNTKGQQKQQCLSNNNELCQWKNKQCQYVKQFDTCSQLVNVSPLTCQLIQNEKCSYFNGSCINSINNNNNECLQYMNQIQCQQQQNECYYNQYQCYTITDDTLYQQLNCNGLSQLSCIKSKKQKCIWLNSKCQIYDQQYFDKCDDQVNQLGCLAKYHKGKLYQNHFCQFDTLTNKCEQNNISIDDCGNNLNINIHRCMSYTKQNCFYQNYQCQSLSNDSNLKIQQLDLLKCDQVNTNICKNITTKDQICILQNRNNFKYCINITYTSLYSEIYTCLELNTQIEGNINICSSASDSCYYDNTSQLCKVQNDINIQYSCNDIISKILCLTQTKDSCIYVNNQCKFYNNSFNNIFCNLRNQNSCENNGRNCIWNQDTKQCIDSDNYCITVYNLNSNVCQNGMGICFSGQNGCISENLINLPCNIGLSKQLCFQQQQICIWQNNKCVDYPQHIKKCSQAENVNECLAIQHLNCIFYKNQCIQDNTGIEQSDYFQYESYQYCMTHPYDIYLTSQMCIQLLGESNNQNFDLDNTFNMQCQLANTMITCVHQRSADCTFKQNKCATINLQSCIQEENVYHSPLTCQSIDNCYWHTNKLGQGFCYQNELKCENIILKSLCLSDMGLQCKYENNQCLTAKFDNCDQIQNIQINYSTCLSLQTDCFYDFQNKLCKKITRQQIQCVDATNLYDCVFSLQNKCLIVYDGIIYQECIDNNNLSYNINNNHFACTQLTDNFYIYSLKTYQCLQINDDVYDCNNLNKKSCLQKTKQLKCIWLENECIYYKQNLGLNCDQLNQQVCLQFTDLNCIWLNNECIEFTNQNDINIQYSQGYCQSIQQLWYKNICYNTNDIFNIISCNDMGLNKQQCLNQVNLECYWNNNKCTSLLDDINYDCNNISKYNCDTEFKCKWNQQINLCEDNKSINLQCDQYTYNSCIQLSNNDCIYVQQLNQCQVINQRVLTLNKCNENLSFQLCKEVINEICTIYDLICQQWTPRLFDCMYIQNHYGCMYAPLSCQWSNNQCQRIIDLNKYNCIDIPKNYNKKGCIEYSIDPCQFDDTLQQCTNKIIYTNQLTNINFKQIPQTMSINCNINKTYNDCMNDWISICQWENDICKQSNQQQCNNQNFQGCLNNEQFCKWRNGKCYQFDYQTNIENIPTLVTYKVCKYFNTQLKLKYDNQSYSCIISNLNIDNCDTIGLNEQSCYKINKSPCIYNNGCQFYQNNESILKCTDIKNVNAKVCQLLSIPCKFDSQINSCIDITDIDLCNSNGLSKQGCINIQSEPCYWDQNQCKQFIVDQSIDQCDNQTFTNKIACQYIDYQQQPCQYDIQNNVCSKQFNRFSLCNTSGLNRYACYQIQLEPCIFKQNQCIQFTNNTEECYFIRNTNSLSCSIQTTQPCTYQQSSNNCVGVPITIPCNSKGINEIACQLQKNCLWNIDTLQCVYKQTKNINQCYNSNQDTCISLQNCYYENNICRLKRCRDLNKEECLINQQLNNEYCYLDIFNQCQIAQKCEDIIQLNEQQQCSLFFINNVSCYQINNQCITSTSYNIICPQSNCLNTNCIKDSGICRALQCSDYLTQQNCPNKDCAFINGICQQINTCSDLQDSIICNEIIVKNEQCSWQPSALRNGPYHCTSKPCYLFSSSTMFCQGNEMNDQVCFISSYAQCESCEEQTDQATCLSSNYCQFVDNKCKSNLCRYFTNEQTCIINDRCYWSKQDQICRKQCIKIVEKDACDLLDYECNWQSLDYTCQNGSEFNLDLSLVIDSPEKKQQIIKFILIIIYLFL